jgi:uncharacterized protein
VVPVRENNGIWKRIAGNEIMEVKFYNMEVELDEHLESCHKGLYIIGDGSGVTHSLSHASASGVYVARQIAKGE